MRYRFLEHLVFEIVLIRLHLQRSLDQSDKSLVNPFTDSIGVDRFYRKCQLGMTFELHQDWQNLQVISQ